MKLLCFLMMVSSASYASLSESILRELVKIDHAYLKVKPTSPVHALHHTYERYFNEGGDIPVIDVSYISRKSRVNFFTLCLNTNIDFLYSKLEGDRKFIMLDDEGSGTCIIRVQFGFLIVDIEPRPTKFQHGNCHIRFAEDIPFNLVELSPLLTNQSLLKDGLNFPIRRGSKHINAFSLLIELELGKRFVDNRGSKDNSLHFLPIAFCLARTIGDWIFSGNRRKRVMHQILKNVSDTDWAKEALEEAFVDGWD
jgi:hypothetical protein